MRLETRPTVTRREMGPLLDLWVAAWSDVMPDIDFEGRRPWLAGRIERGQARGAALLVARDEAGTMLGFAFVEPGAGDLDQVAVHPRHQGRGVASALVAAAKALSPEGLGLSVNQDNRRALGLYERHGFRIVGQGTGALSGLPLWHMRWSPEAASTRDPTGGCTS